MAGIIIKTRITPPKPPVKIVRRERLLRVLEDNINKKIILICSPAGYGKTTLVQDFLTTHNNYTWFHVTNDTDNIYTFFNYLIHSLKHLKENFGQNTIQMLESNRERYRLNGNQRNFSVDIIGTFTNEFRNSFSDDVTIVIDDLHNIGKSNWLRTAFDVLIENFPENLHLIITSRQVPDINLNFLSSKRMILMLELDDLNFKKDEIKKLLSEIYSIPYSDEEVSLLEKKLSGWITGLHLILQAYGRNFTKIKFEHLKIPENIFKFFAEEIYKRLNDKTRNFLLKTALLENFTPPLCNQLLKISNSDKIIEDLLSKNIFIQTEPVTSESSPNIYSYQIMFKKFLELKFSELIPQRETRRLLETVRDYYLKRNDIISAMNYILLAEDYKNAAATVKDNFRKLFDEGKYDILWKWMNAINAETIEKDPYLLYCRSLLQKFFGGDLEGALPYLKRAVSILEKGKDKNFLLKCFISEADILLSLGKTQEAMKLLNRLNAQKATAENKAKLLYSLAMAHYKNSRYDDSIPLLFKSLDICKQKNLKEILRDIFRLLGNIYLIRGEYTKSIYYYEQVVERTNNVTYKFETICNLVLLFSQSDNYEKAKESLDMATEMIKQFPIPIIMIAYLIAKQAYYYEYGDYEENLRIIQEFTALALKLNHKYYIYLGYSLTADTYYYLNKLGKAREYYDLANDYLDQKNELEKIQYDTMDALMQKKIRITPAIEKTLLNAYTYYNSNKFIYNKVQVAFHLADYYLKSGMSESAYYYLDECLNISSEKDYVSFLQRELMDSQLLFDFASAKGIQKSFVRSIKDSVIEKVNTPWLSPDCRQRLSELAERLYDVKVNTFGIPEVRVRGIPIPESRWLKKKRKYIFIYLLMSAHKELTKDKIIDFFYRDSPFETAENLYHQSISIIKNLVKFEPVVSPAPETKPKEKPGKRKKTTKKFSFADKLTGVKLYEGMQYPPIITYEDKILRFNKYYNYFIDANEFNRMYKLASETEGSEKIEYLKKAIDIYRGEFLSGFYDPWSEDLRNDYSNKFISMCEELIRTLYESGNYEEAARYSEKLLQFDKLNETAYMKIIESLVKMEKHNTARDKLQMLRRAYKDEASAEPDEKLIRRIEAVING